MRTSHKLTNVLSVLATLLALATVAMAQAASDPGTPFPATSAVSDQKAGSVLIYNVYVSSASNPGAENSRINITNTSSSDATVHFFFVDGSNCGVADNYVCLTANQTMSFNMSDIDPGIMGYIVAVATDTNGNPISNNFLIGDEYVKFASGHAANLGAEAIALVGAAPTVDLATMTAALAFNNTVYNALPRVLAIDHVLSRGDGNSTLVVINSIRGDLRTAAGGAGDIFGILYDPLENPYSFTYSAGCQRKAILGVDFPKTAPPYNSIVSAGSYGWMKFWAVADRALLGAAINFNANAGNNQNAFNGGHNLHKLTFTTAATLTIPVFPSNCEFD